MGRMSRASSRATALAILVGLIGLVYVAIVEPVIATFDEYDEAITRSEALLPQYQQLASRRSELQAVLERLNDETTAAGGYLDAASETLAAAELQKRIKEVTGRYGVRLASTQVLPPAKEGDAVRITVRAKLEGTTGSLRDIFYALEADRPYLFLDDIDLRTARRATIGARAREVEDDGEVGLMARLDVSGYMKQAGR